MDCYYNLQEVAILFEDLDPLRGKHIKFRLCVPHRSIENCTNVPV